MANPKNYLELFKDDNPKDIIELMRIVRNKPKDDKYYIPYNTADIVSWDEGKYISPLFIEGFCSAFKKHPFYKVDRIPHFQRRPVVVSRFVLDDSQHFARRCDGMPRRTYV